MTLHERSYGVIPLRKRNDRWQVLLVQLHAGHWGFPKGHPEENEAPISCALRELFEETGLSPASGPYPFPLLEESYQFLYNHQLIFKTVTYFVFVVKGQCHIQKSELADARWVPLEAAEQIVTFDGLRKIIARTATLIWECKDKSPHSQI